jgi:hypothetical protein
MQNVARIIGAKECLGFFSRWQWNRWVANINQGRFFLAHLQFHV